MMDYIIDENNYKGKSIGTKASNLFKLQELKLNIPMFFCINSFCSDEDFQNINSKIEDLLTNTNFKDEKELKKAEQNIKKIIENLEFGKEKQEKILKTINTKYKEVKTFSIRSSSSMEDSINSSFAGQFATFLNVNKNDILKYIIKCFSSLYSANVLKYASEKNLDIKDFRMSVIVEEMIDSDMSGIIFTANPQGLLNELVVVVGNGTGNNIVEDKVPATTYYYNKTDKTYYFETKENSPLLKTEFFNELIKISEKISESFGEYIDIEYAIKNNKIYILQTRPITTINNDNKVVLDNSNIVESYPGITLPLTYSFITDAYSGVFKNVIYRILKNETQTNEYDPIFKEMLGTVNGRVYYKISNWYTLIKLLPFSKKIVPIWQDMMGVQEKKVSEVKKENSVLQRVKIYLNSLFEFFKIPKNMKKLEEDFNEINAYYHNTYRDNLNNSELVTLYNKLMDKVLNNWGITLLNDGYAFLYTGLLKARFKKMKIENYEYVTNEYISGITNIESIKPIKELIKIANLIVTENKKKDLEKLKNNADVSEYLKNSGSLQQEINKYIKNFGDRSLEELKLESMTFRSSPILLINKLLEYTSDNQKLASITLSLSETQLNEVNNVIKNSSFINKAIINYLSKRAMLGIKNREISRLNRSRLYGMARSIFLGIGTNFKNSNIIAETNDIFYLEKNEIFSYINKKNLNINLKDIIKLRKDEFKLYEQLPMYTRLIFSEKEFNKVHTNINSTKLEYTEKSLIGTPCSNGIVEGEVIVINNPKEAIDVKDKILVTKMTDPGWVFLLTLAKGIVTEKGSLLSHTAIISRELNIPSIVGVTNVTSILKTGDYVKIDGNTGRIEKVVK